MARNAYHLSTARTYYGAVTQFYGSRLRRFTGSTYECTDCIRIWILDMADAADA